MLIEEEWKGAANREGRSMLGKNSKNESFNARCASCGEPVVVLREHEGTEAVCDVCF